MSASAAGTPSGGSAEKTSVTMTARRSREAAAELAPLARTARDGALRAVADALVARSAEIGISTQKLHARGPMGLRELTSTKYVVTGSGHIRD